MSESGYIKDKHYQFLLQYFPAPKIYNRFKSLWADTVKALENIGPENKFRML
jgi:hypothetical protein